MKSLREISWNVDEPTYRADPALSYSTLSTYERGGGFASLSTLFDRKESPSLLLGSCVDTLITGSEEEFDNLFMVADFPSIGDKELAVVKKLFSLWGSTYDSLELIPNEVISTAIEEVGYQSNWKPETRVKVIKEKCSEYYKLLCFAEGKTVVSSEMYNDALRMVDALRTAPSTKFLYQSDSPFEPNIERLYQLKFKANLGGVDYRCMADEIVVFHDKKLILPTDLKTSHKVEYEFYKSFVEWGYIWQSKLYYAIIKDNIEKDDYFKDFTLLPYVFVVVNKNSLNPLCWKIEDSVNPGDFIYGKDKQYRMRSPFTIGKELRYYLDNPTNVPIGVSTTDPNDLQLWLNKL